MTGPAVVWNRGPGTEPRGAGEVQIVSETRLAFRGLQNAVDVQKNHRVSPCFVLHRNALRCAPRRSSYRLPWIYRPNPVAIVQPRATAPAGRESVRRMGRYGAISGERRFPSNLRRSLPVLRDRIDSRSMQHGTTRRDRPGSGDSSPHRTVLGEHTRLRKWNSNPPIDRSGARRQEHGLAEAT